MTEIFLQLSWFTIFVILLTGYAVLDGFDLGVGMLHLFSKEDDDRRIMLNTIGPVWDGNEVWLVTAGGALFAGFPIAYATLCTAFYIPVMILLAGLIFRAVAIEFRSKQPMQWWRWTWDVLFALASFIIAVGLGSVIGNLIQGIPLDSEGEYAGTFMQLINPYAILVGLMTASLFCMHGAIYLMMKTDGVFHEHMRRFVNPTIIAFIMLYAVTTAATLIYNPHMVEAFKHRSSYFLIAIINMIAVANIPREIYYGRDGRAFLSSCLNIICLLALYGVGTFPNIIYASNDPANLSLTVYNSSSSVKTLIILHIIAGIGVPMVLAYTTAIYWIFKGKTRLDSSSY
ncbi:MAG: cytochrome d ubiquinol oxidase subunit II [Chlamydiales bacterium]|nr:cytochrome d ubiquinol oxidase subunit II [Chlamydiia bacterium]MCP5506716.1 cytochrome d ubiquinol oxidase subunit II [Chlamydiales bacterium]